MPELRRILEVLASHEVDFVVVGGLAAVLQGAPTTTYDVDIVYSLAKPNQEKLLRALEELDATFRGDPRRLRPNLSHLDSKGHKLLTTRLGDLDCLGTIETDTTYEDLLEHVDWIEIDSRATRVLTLERLIEVKRKLKRPKDQLMLLQLEATLDERGKS